MAGRPPLSALIATSRLASLVGPGGAGKTRLAVEAIRRASPAAEVVFVPLEPVRQPASLVPAVASGLRVRDQPGLAIQESLATALATAPRLLVLDGAEHLRDAVAELAGQLLAAVDGLRIVVTSRVVLGVPGEVCWTVPPLQCPSGAAGAADIAASDAVRLFITRAQERVPGFAGAAPHAIAELFDAHSGVLAAGRRFTIGLKAGALRWPSGSGEAAAKAGRTGREPTAPAGAASCSGEFASGNGGGAAG